MPAVCTSGLLNRFRLRQHLPAEQSGAGRHSSAGDKSIITDHLQDRVFALQVLEPEAAMIKIVSKIADHHIMLLQHNVIDLMVGRRDADSERIAQISSVVAVDDAGFGILADRVVASFISDCDQITVPSGRMIDESRGIVKIDILAREVQVSRILECLVESAGALRSCSGLVVRDLQNEAGSTEKLCIAPDPIGDAEIHKVWIDQADVVAGHDEWKVFYLLTLSARQRRMDRLELCQLPVAVFVRLRLELVEPEASGIGQLMGFLTYLLRTVQSDRVSAALTVGVVRPMIGHELAEGPIASRKAPEAVLFEENSRDLREILLSHVGELILKAIEQNELFLVIQEPIEAVPIEKCCLAGSTVPRTEIDLRLVAVDVQLREQRLTGIINIIHNYILGVDKKKVNC